MLASLADSMAALRRMLTLGSPPPLRAATVISRRIFEKSLHRCTSVLPFLRLICDQRECPDIVLPSFPRAVVDDGRLQALDPLQPLLAPNQRRLPEPLLGRGLRREGRAGPRPQIRPKMHIGEIGPAGLANLT